MKKISLFILIFLINSHTLKAYKEMAVWKAIDDYYSNANSSHSPVQGTQSWLNPLWPVTSLGNAFRWTGDAIRSTAAPTHQALSSIPLVGTGSAVALPAGATSYALLGAGNSLRWTGSWISSETPTLARHLYDHFWIEDLSDYKKAEFDTPVDLFNATLISTACTLFLQPKIKNLWDIKATYKDFFETVPHRNATYINTIQPSGALDCLLKGAVRAHRWAIARPESFENLWPGIKTRLSHLYTSNDQLMSISYLKDQADPWSTLQTHMKTEWSLAEAEKTKNIREFEKIGNRLSSTRLSDIFNYLY